MKTVKLTEQILWRGEVYQPGDRVNVPDDLAAAIASAPPSQAQLQATNPEEAQKQEEQATKKGAK